MTRRVVNFGAGPAMLPDDILAIAREELMDWQGTGMSVMEVGHRTPDFMKIAQHAEDGLRKLMGIPDNYHVLFLAGGATLQFSVVPMNLVRGKSSADYIDTGIWSAKAMRIAEPYLNVNQVCSAKESGYKHIPAVTDWRLDENAAYCYYTENETVGGVEFQFVPEVNVPLVCDMTSSILSRPVDVSRYGVIFAGAQKNVAPAGMTIVIVDKALCGEVLPTTPDLLNYQMQADDNSMLNTPPTFNWYMAGLMFDWLQKKGGLQAMEKINIEKSSLLYDLIDDSDFYRNDIDISCRSRMNVIFHLQDDKLMDPFLQEAKDNGLLALKGHRLAGGLRASIYNAMPLQSVQQLADFMQEFERRYG
ncbi:MAG: 3-phosphoserine/phosphohydroxythreonine transaminase [Gammaproteobacteria bacterium]